MLSGQEHAAEVEQQTPCLEVLDGRVTTHWV